ncbi:MAG: ABC transporter ATP-binding protein [Candidatus Saccharibacteria bacterium]
MKAIETKKLTKSYGKERGIVDLDLSIEEGEFFGFIGPNGSGKSTTIRTLLGLIFPSSGTATVFGKDISKFGPEIREQIGYLPSEVFYYDNMRAIDLLRYSASFYKLDKSHTDKKIHDLASQLNLDLNKKIDNLSYGNKKKVGIIQGLLHSPKLIILDEPTGGLDPLIQQKFFDILKVENKKGATILFSSHILSEVQKLCGRVAIIKEGKIIKVEEISSLIKNTYKRVTLDSAKVLIEKDFKIPGISDFKSTSGSVSFLYNGDINIVTKIIAGQNLTNLLIQEPDLEEIFLHYYKEGE